MREVSYMKTYCFKRYGTSVPADHVQALGKIHALMLLRKRHPDARSNEVYRTR